MGAEFREENVSLKRLTAPAMAIILNSGASRSELVVVIVIWFQRNTAQRDIYRARYAHGDYRYLDQ